MFQTKLHAAALISAVLFVAFASQAHALNQRLPTAPAAGAVGTHKMARKFRPQQRPQQPKQQQKQRRQSSSRLTVPSKCDVTAPAAAEYQEIVCNALDLEHNVDDHHFTYATKTTTGTSTTTTTASQNDGIRRRVFDVVKRTAKIDKERIAKLGTTFALTYNFVSNVNGSITMACSWFLASSRTGLSPLAPGQWKSLLSAYASLYAIVTVLRPLRVALAVGLSSSVEKKIKSVESRLSCNRSKAVALLFSVSIVSWGALSVAGVLIASEVSGVPIY
eukprot:CAMPEP_0119561512 /NCGR_PEP_ID=MMETSP1352-20130426/17821_1 /TAXON_ID=265584 /ORGANISM="Stauroneis constricta, Strain CCMP1120" /LENGTH=275 /DNA_ID=CAMNT_0007609729 /DNA_START=29 /DNA_END=856 /DNA_ORIENTATION=+